MIHFKLFSFNKTQNNHLKKPAPLRLSLSNNDLFGQNIQVYHQQLPSQQQAAIDKFVKKLIQTGSQHRAPKSWSWLRAYSNGHFSKKELLNLSHNWWLILQEVNYSHNNQKAYLCKQNTAFARAIIWLYIYLHGQSQLNNYLHFINQQQYQNTALAETAVDILMQQHYFKYAAPSIQFHYPQLLSGRIGKKLSSFFGT